MDPAVLAKIAEGKYAASVLDVFADFLSALCEETLKGADRLMEDHRLTPELAFAIVHELGAYRRIRYRLEHKVRRAEHLRAADVRAHHGDGETPAAGTGQTSYAPTN